MRKGLWFLVVFKNEKLSYYSNLVVGKGGFEPPALVFFQNNFNMLQRRDLNPCGSLWLRFLKSSKYAHNDRLIKFLGYIRLKRFLCLKTEKGGQENGHKFI